MSAAADAASPTWPRMVPRKAHLYTVTHCVNRCGGKTLKDYPWTVGRGGGGDFLKDTFTSGAYTVGKREGELEGETKMYFVFREWSVHIAQGQQH